MTGARGRSWVLWEVVDESALIVRGVVRRLPKPAEAVLRVDEVLKGAWGAAELAASGPEPNFPHTPAPDWKEGAEVLVALAGEAAPHRLLGGAAGVLGLAQLREEKIETVRDLVRIGRPDPLGDRDREAGRAALVALLRRPVLLSVATALSAIQGWPRAARFLTPEAGREVIALTREPDWEVRRDAAWACGALPVEDAAGPLIDLLDDESKWVKGAAGTTLVRLTSQDFGFDPDAPADRRAIAVARWRRWHEAEKSAAR